MHITNKIIYKKLQGTNQDRIMKRRCAAVVSEYDCELPYTIYEYDHGCGSSRHSGHGQGLSLDDVPVQQCPRDLADDTHCTPEDIARRSVRGISRILMPAVGSTLHRS